MESLQLQEDRRQHRCQFLRLLGVLSNIVILYLPTSTCIQLQNQLAACKAHVYQRRHGVLSSFICSVRPSQPEEKWTSIHIIKIYNALLHNRSKILTQSSKTWNTSLLMSLVVFGGAKSSLSILQQQNQALPPLADAERHWTRSTWPALPPRPGRDHLGGPEPSPTSWPNPKSPNVPTKSMHLSSEELETAS